VVEINWSIDRVLREHERAKAEGQPEGPGLPIYRWNALHRLRDLEEEYQLDGSGFVVLAAVRVCANHALVMPEWVAQAFINSYDKVLNARAGSWDDAFGRPYPKGKHLNTARRSRVLPIAVYLEGKRILADKQSTIDDDFFEDLGSKFGLSKTIANEMYYEGRRRYGPPSQDDL